MKLSHRFFIMLIFSCVAGPLWSAEKPVVFSGIYPVVETLLNRVLAAHGYALLDDGLEIKFSKSWEPKATNADAGTVGPQGCLIQNWRIQILVTKGPGIYQGTAVMNLAIDKDQNLKCTSYYPNGASNPKVTLVNQTNQAKVYLEISPASTRGLRNPSGGFSLNDLGLELIARTPVKMAF